MYRPDRDDPETLDWEDNFASNGMAWASATVLPKWCKSERHWTVRLSEHLWAECSCCHFFRGATLGLVFGACLTLPVGLLLGAILF